VGRLRPLDSGPSNGGDRRISPSGLRFYKGFSHPGFRGWRLAPGQSCAFVDLTSSDGVTSDSRPARPNWNGAVRPSLCANQSRSRRSACPVYYLHERDAALLPKLVFNSVRNSCPDLFFLIEPATMLPGSVLFRSTSLPPSTTTLKSGPCFGRKASTPPLLYNPGRRGRSQRGFWL
jgi:hypothetical protein